MDILVCMAGTGGTGFGTASYLRSRNPNLQVVLVQPHPDSRLTPEHPDAQIIDGVLPAYDVPESALSDYLRPDWSDACINVRTEEAYETAHEVLRAVYFGRDNDVLDYNDVSVQIGKDTLCEMHTAGVLTGNADKILRGTVDFRRGAKRGVGHESEDVLMFSPTARNRTAPLILCGEEEVEGQHAASVGRLDEGKLYYLRSRGLSESQARRLMVDARFAPAIEKIPLEELRTEVRETVARRLDDEQLDG